MHGFFNQAGVLPGAADGLDYVTAAIDERLAGEPAPGLTETASA
jgi:hypothetical protein